jgi:hypothetical protein
MSSVLRPFALVLVLGVAGSLLVGCSNKPKEEEDEGPMISKRGGGAGAGTAQKTAMHSGKGTLKGRVTMEGDRPDVAALTADLRDKMAKSNDKAQCLAPTASDDEKSTPAWRISGDGGVADVFVLLRPDPEHFFATDESNPTLQEIKKKPDLYLDQPHCAFIPHAFVVFPSYRTDKNEEKPTGQKFFVKNSSKIGHNTKYPGGNPNLGSGDTFPVTNLKPAYTPVTFACNVHPWMNADAFVLDHPYYAVTDKDGNFEIKNVPTGKVQIIAWHGAAQFLNEGGVRGQAIDLTDKENVHNFTCKKK